VTYIINHINLLPKKFGQAYWNWGVGAASLMLLVLPLSVLPIRKRAYEFFLAAHNIMAIGIFVACYYHIYMNYQHEWGYENWIYLPVGLWLLDRGLRLMRLARNGLRTATITRLDDDYLRIDVPGVDVSGHVFLYFPTLRIWQTHPFSVAASSVEMSIEHTTNTTERFSVNEELAAAASEWHALAVDDSDDDSDDAASNGIADEHKQSHMPLVTRQTTTQINDHDTPNDEKREAHAYSETAPLTQDHTTLPQHPPTTSPQQTTRIPGATFYIRRQTGLTAHLFRSALTCLPILLEGPYNPSKPIPATTHLVCIAGGVGITGALPAFTAHIGARIAGGVQTGSMSALYWSCHSPELVRDVEGRFLAPLQRNAGFHDDTAGATAADGDGMRVGDVQIKTEGRWDVERIVLERARAVVERGGEVVVLVCGPPGMADGVRRAVVKVNLGAGQGRRRDKIKCGYQAVGRVRLIEEGFWW
jgi:hypothetical protein